MRFSVKEERKKSWFHVIVCHTHRDPFVGCLVRPCLLPLFRLSHFRVNAGIMQPPRCRAEEDPMNIVVALLHRVYQYQCANFFLQKYM